MTVRAAAIVAGALIVLTGVSACGSDSLSLRDLRSRATGVCAAANRRAERIANPSSPAGSESFIHAGVRNLALEVTGLSAATPPSGSADDYRQAVGALSRIVDALRVADRRLSAGGDPVLVVRGLQGRVEPLRRSADERWRSLGIAGCLSA